MLPDKNLKIHQNNAEYLLSSDVTGKLLIGGRNYMLHLPEDIPHCNYWSVIVYDSATRLIIKNRQLWPSININCKKLMFNQDGSLDILFGPNVPSGMENNWIQTIKGKSWYAIIRLYDVWKSRDDIIWHPDGIKPADSEL